MSLAPKSLRESSRRRWLQYLLCAGGQIVCWPGHAAASAVQPLLAERWQPEAGRDPRDYLVSEKLDGVRALWDGQTLRFRSGREVAAPDAFLKRLPLQALDGELWLGRGQFERVSGLVRKTTALAGEWQPLQYRVFELPGSPGPFSERAVALQKLVQGLDWPQLQAVAQGRVDNEAALMAQLKRVVQAGGEGLMLHRADSPWHSGRSDALLKLKPLDDAEATVIAHLPGKGKYRGLMGGLQVQDREGRVFVIGTGFSDADRAQPPSVGSMVSFSHQGRTATGVPRFARYVRPHLEL